ncbi:hypothetical protein JRO89_XSUnG0112400 [Xanthoceras sorbifolium]|uniref:Rx N-terminal domain-containing protein n=1 Tax=Xanthoceras sorbifolium TaxID=99658 RepID=A0ABQ8GYH5_9ROSI|nr:hypothetical protein JRO89_XSUnG0112400 [Xanthoceras sorbifolium]
MEAVLADAKEKQLTYKLVKMWLDDLRDLAYDMDDLLDEFATEELERKLMSTQHHNSNFLLDAGRALVSYTGMKSKMDGISTRLDQLWEDKEDLGSVKNIAGAPTSTAAAAYQRQLTTSVPTEPAVYGRDEDTTKILGMVLTDMVLSDLLPTFKKLRALSLRTYYITELPNSIDINLSRTMIINLPESISSLYNLQILMLRGCSCLLKLPPNLRNLINLRHLNISGASLILEMPLGMRELKSLKKLSNFIVGRSIGSDLEDLKNLKRLCISKLNNVIDFDPRDLVLRDKKGLKELLLEWESQFDDSRKEVVEETVLEMLIPHQNLEMLTITGYGGKKFPSWVGDPSFSNIRYLRLERCENCTSLPSLGLLELLKELNIRNMKSLKSIGSEIYGNGCSKPFQSLETLRFEYLQEWEHWEPIKENQFVDAFPCLRKLYIRKCPKLSGRLPDHLPSLEKLVIVNCYELVVSFSSIPLAL